MLRQYSALSKTLVSGRSVTMSDYEAYCISPHFLHREPQVSLGLPDSNQAVVGVIRATSDQHEGIDVPEGNYSVKDAGSGMIFMKGLDAAST
jgi:hypothetical protein